MARGLNRITLVGNIGNNPELRHTPDGVATTTTSLAVRGTRRREDGVGEETTEWFRLVAFETQAETLAKHGQQGRPLFVEGRIQTRPYNDRNGIVRNAIEVVVSNFLLLGTGEAASTKTQRDDAEEGVRSG